jgi:hypothetical protein
MRAVTPVVLFILMTTILHAQNPKILEIGQKIFHADFILEVELRFVEPVSGGYPADSLDQRNFKFPPYQINAAMRTLDIIEYLKPSRELTGIVLPPYIHLFNPNSPCWWDAHQKGTLRTLVFFREKSDGTLEHLAGDEQEWGHYTTLNPDYDLLKAAVVKGTSWDEADAFGTSTPGDYSAQVAALHEAGNPYLQLTAAEYLRRNGQQQLLEKEIDYPDGVHAWEAMLMQKTRKPICRHAVQK